MRVTARSPSARSPAWSARRATAGHWTASGSRPPFVADITRAMPVASDVEVFGPVLSVIPVEGTAEAVATANASRYALSGSVFWRDVSRARAVAMPSTPAKLSSGAPASTAPRWRRLAASSRAGSVARASPPGCSNWCRTKTSPSGGRVFGPVSGFRGARLVVSLLTGAGVVRSVPFGSSQGGDGWRLKRGYSVASVGASRSPASGAFTKPVS